MNYPTIPVLLVAIALIFAGCKKDILKNDPLVDNIPADASAVTAVNMGNLYDKVGFDWLKSLDFYEEIINSSRSENKHLAELLQDPSKSGVDMDGYAYIIQRPDESDAGFVGIMLPLESSGKLEKVMDKLDAPVARGTNYNYLSEDGKSLLAWNDEMIVLGIGADKDATENKIAEILEGPQEKLEKQPNFKNFSSAEHDISSWVSTDAIKGMSGLGEILESSGLEVAMLENNYVHTAFDFNEKNIEGSFEVFLNNDLKRELKVLTRDKPVHSIVGDFPVENRLLTYSAAIDSRGVYQLLLERSIVLGPVNKELKKYDLNIKDISKAFTGDMAMSLYEVKGIDEPVPVVGLATSSSPSFDKVWNTALDNNFLDTGSKEGIYTLPPEYSKRGKYVKKTASALFFSPSVEALDLIETGAGNTGDTHAHMSALSVDMKGLSHMLGSEVDPNFTKLEAYSDLESGKMKMDVKGGELNSIQTVFDFINDIHLKQMEKYPRQNEGSKSL